MKRLSQNRLYGELLSSEHQYRKELQVLPVMGEEEEQALVRRARAGEPEAKKQFLESCLADVQRSAKAYSWRFRGSFRLEYEELLGIGNIKLVECLEKALSKENPPGYLRRCAQLEMYRYCLYHQSLIPTPNTGKDSDIPVESLDYPLPDDPDLTLSDVLEQEPERPKKHYDALYQALTFLTEKQAEALTFLYGLGECAPHSYQEYAAHGRKTPLDRKTVAEREEGGLDKMRMVLPSSDVCLSLYSVKQACARLQSSTATLSRVLSKRGIRPVCTGLYKKEEIEQVVQERAQKAQQTNRLTHENLLQQRLGKAYLALCARGEKVTVKALEAEAGVESKIASLYLCFREELVYS